MKPELLFLILFLFGFVLYCFLGNTKAFYKKIEGMDTLETTSSTESPSTSSTAPSTTASVATSSTTTTSSASPSYENYNHYKGTSIATKYYGPNGEVIVINSPYSITVINTSGVSVEYTASISSGSTNIESIKFVGPNGAYAKLVKGSNGGNAIKVTDAYGNSVIYGEKPVSSSSSPSYSSLFTNPLTTYYGSTGNPVPNNSAYAYVSPAPLAPPVVSYDQPQSSYNYSSSLPPGIPRSQILPGQEDLYILKSQVVPPVCPACNPVVIYKDKECQACPACARCPEPSFECKKVPNYNAVNNEYLPTPILNSFSGFGM